MSAGNFYLGPKGFIRASEMGCPDCDWAKTDITGPQNTFSELSPLFSAHYDLLTQLLGHSLFILFLLK